MIETCRQQERNTFASVADAVHVDFAVRQAAPLLAGRELVTRILANGGTYISAYFCTMRCAMLESPGKGAAGRGCP